MNKMKNLLDIWPGWPKETRRRNVEDDAKTIIPHRHVHHIHPAKWFWSQNVNGCQQQYKVDENRE